MDKNIVALHTFIRQALNEDLGDGDHTSNCTIPPGYKGRAKLLIKDTGILAGVSIAREIFLIVDPALTMEIFMEDGQVVQHGDVAFHVNGSVHSILLAERLVLNIMQRMSGIATTTNKVVKLLEGTGTKVLDTRKTTPGLRYLEKLAVKIGGGVNHRFGLYDMVLIKDNHVDYAGGIAKAIEAAKSYLKKKNLDIPIEIEVRNLSELIQAINSGGVDRILLDNFTFEKLEEAVALIKGRFITEASGGITLDNVLEYARCGVDFVSMGALTHSVKSLDMSLKAIQTN
ncbi:carboxylating nicotinate-nucleotide diphosphorylase [Daejeonella sp.]|uniref:carboxylating nicotinate-nucleotide diphosphorylase n=1 Tax=Daejeonella sp. TaxID=2805397 RepID=UPI0039836E07